MDENSRQLIVKAILVHANMVLSDSVVIVIIGLLICSQISGYAGLPRDTQYAKLLIPRYRYFCVSLSLS